MSVKILMLLNAAFPPDIRVRKEADTLIKEGYEVILLCLRRKGEPYEEEFERIQIRRIDAGKNNYILAFWDVIMSIFFIHFKFYNKARKLVQSNQIHLIHVHDLPLAGTALKLKKNLGIKVVLDLHENYPDAIDIWFSWKKNPITRLKNFLFMNSTRWRNLERIAVQNSDRVITVVEEMKDRICQSYQIEENKIFVVPNTENKNFVQQSIDDSVYAGFQNKFIITYTGGIGPHRGVDTVIKGMSLLNKYDDIIFVLVGSGSTDTIVQLKETVKQNQLERNVFFLGHQPFQKVFSYMVLADVNVIPHKSNPQNDNGLPHKLCQNMMVGKPVLVSSSRPLKRIVEMYESGLVFEAENPNDFAAKVLELYSDELLRKKLAENGVKASLNGEFNWEETGQVLLKAYVSLLPVPNSHL